MSDTNTETNAVETNTENNGNTEMLEKLQAAGEKAVKQKAERRARTVRGSHLLQPMKDMVTTAGCTMEEQSGFYKVSGGVKGKDLYIAKKGGTVNFRSFTLDHTAVKSLSEQEARERHLGKVRGQIDFEKTDEEVLGAFSTALDEIKKA